MVMGVQRKTRGDGWDTLVKKLQSLKSTSVLVGITAEKTTRNDEGINNAELLYAHTHGIRHKKMRQEMQCSIAQGMPYSLAHQLYIQSHGSPIYASPPRPVIEPAIEANKRELGRHMGTGLRDFLKTGSTAGLRKTGLYAVTKAKAWFDDPRNNWAPNSPLTIARKGSSKPLIDKGELRNAITYTIRKDQ